MNVDAAAGRARAGQNYVNNTKHTTYRVVRKARGRTSKRKGNVQKTKVQKHKSKTQK